MVMAVINTITIISMLVREAAADLGAAAAQSDLGMMHRSTHDVFIIPSGSLAKLRKKRGSDGLAR